MWFSALQLNTSSIRVFNSLNDKNSVSIKWDTLRNRRLHETNHFIRYKQLNRYPKHTNITMLHNASCKNVAQFNFINHSSPGFPLPMPRLSLTAQFHAVE